MRRHVPGPAFAGVLAACLMALLPAFANPYILFIANQLAIYVILSIGLNLLVGYCGQLAFAQAALFGIGAYTTGLLRVDFGMPFLLAIPLGVLLTTLIGVTMALPALRLSGHYLALLTLAFAQVTNWVFLHWEGVTFGGGGFRVPASDTGAVSPGIVAYYAALASAILLMLLAARIVASRTGRAMIAVRDGEVAAESLGIDLLRTKAVAFGLSAAFAGVAGGLQVLMLGFVAPESYDLFQMVLQQTMIVVGGIGSLAGSVIGAAALLCLLEGLRAFKSVQEIVFGALLLGTVVLAPKGIAALFARAFPSWRESYLGAPHAPETAVAAEA